MITNSAQTGMIRPHQSKLAFFFRMLDAFLILISLWVAIQIYDITWSGKGLVIGIVAASAFSFFAEGFNLYRIARSVLAKEYIFPISLTWSISFLVVVGVINYVDYINSYSWITLLMWYFLTPILMIVFRFIVTQSLSYIRSKGFHTRNVAIVGTGRQAIQLMDVINSTSSFGYNLLGLFEDRAIGRGRYPEETKAHIVGSISELIQKTKEHQIDLIYIALSLKGEDRIKQLINDLRDTTASIHLVPDLSTYDLLSSRWANLGAVPTISILESPFLGVNGWLKRTEDIILSVLILTVIAVPMVILAIGVKLTSPGPIIFRQRRYGLDGQPIKVLKFRSMKVCDDGGKIEQAKKGDSRITPFGAFLRRTSLDELPQFINVLLGEMSIVGPRPHAVAHNESYRKLIAGYMIRHKVPPGITGWAQVNGWRGETETLDKMEKRVEYDMWYIKNWSIWLDLIIIIKTVIYGFVGRNAY